MGHSTSTNGVSEFVKASKELDIQTYPKIAVIGSATEKALNNLGLTAILSPHQHVAESLLEIFPSPEGNNNVLLSVAAKSRELLPTTLKEEAGTFLWFIRTNQLGPNSSNRLITMKKMLNL